MSKRTRTISWIGQIIAVVILGQSLFFKFSGAPEAVHIFTALGVEPWGRIGLGVVELVTVVLLLVPNTAAIGAAIGVGLMIGAIGSHLTVLGVSVQGDGGGLFAMAWVVLLACGVVAAIRRRELPVVGSRWMEQGEHG
jgi:hypothetical protein